MTEEEAKKKVCKQIPVFDELGILRGGPTGYFAWPLTV